MEWKQEQIPKNELEKKQSTYMKMAMDMAKRSTVNPDISKKKAYEEKPETHKKAFEEKPETPKKAFEEKPHKKVFEEKPPEAVPEVVAKPPRPPEVVEEKPPEAVAPPPPEIRTERVIERVPEVIVEKVPEVRVERVIERIPEVIVEKVPEVRVEKEVVVVEKTPEIHLNQSKNIEINADVNINAGALFVKAKEKPPAPELVIEETKEEAPPAEVIGEVKAEVLEETCEEICEEVTSTPFENFKACECEEKPRVNRCENSPPPNFNNFINEHNMRSCGCNNSGTYGNQSGGYSWKNFKKN
ncbi:MAG: hypothetical protein FWH08_01905 [Oscillospiraceae bacterium]|nr:hypothetical protein [Oscillospiraceae bacterium]